MVGVRWSGRSLAGSHGPYCEHIIAGFCSLATSSAASRAIRYTGIGKELADCRGVEGATVLEPALVHYDDGVGVAEEFDLKYKVLVNLSMLHAIESL
jgi:hypothetical protein